MPHAADYVPRPHVVAGAAHPTNTPSTPSAAPTLTRDLLIKAAEKGMRHWAGPLSPYDKRGCEAIADRILRDEPAASPERVREQAIEDSPTWPWVLAFAHEMEAKLAENRHKGDREGWARSGAYDLLHRLRQEADELELRIDHGCQNGLPESTVIGEAAEVANFAMMIADAAGGLRALAAAGGAGET